MDANLLIEAAAVGDCEVADKLLNAGVPINYAHSINKWYILLIACYRSM